MQNSSSFVKRTSEKIFRKRSVETWIIFVLWIITLVSFFVFLGLSTRPAIFTGKHVITKTVPIENLSSEEKEKKYNEIGKTFDEQIIIRIEDAKTKEATDVQITKPETKMAVSSATAMITFFAILSATIVFTVSSPFITRKLTKKNDKEEINS